VKSHRILGIVVGRNGKLHGNHAQLLHKLLRHLILIQIYKRQLNPKQQRRTYIMYVQSILDYQLLAIWPSFNKEQRLQLTRTGYKGARFILQAPATVDGSICCREAHIFPPAERYEILLMKRYYPIRRHEEDQLTIAALLHALSQLDPPVGVIHLADTSRSLEHDQIQERQQTLRRRLWENYAVEFPERAKRLRNFSIRFPERLFKICAFRARTESIKTMVWRSKHKQLLKHNSQESEISRTCRRCGQSNETMTHLFEDCPHPESLRAHSRALHKLFEEAQIDARTWEEIVTRKADPAVTSVLEKVIHDFVHTLLNEDKLRSKKYSLI